MIADAVAPASWALRGLFWIALVWFVKSAQPVLAPVGVALLLALLVGPGVRMLKRCGVPIVAGRR